MIQIHKVTWKVYRAKQSNDMWIQLRCKLTHEENIYVTPRWDKVTCRECLRHRPDKAVREELWEDK